MVRVNVVFIPFFKFVTAEKLCSVGTAMTLAWVSVPWMLRAKVHFRGHACHKDKTWVWWRFLGRGLGCVGWFRKQSFRNLQANFGYGRIMMDMVGGFLELFGEFSETLPFIGKSEDEKGLSTPLPRHKWTSARLKICF